MTADDDVRMGVIGHGGLLRVFSFAPPVADPRGVGGVFKPPLPENNHHLMIW